MAVDLCEFVKHLRCPDDAAELRASGHEVSCPRCGRHFPVIGDRIVEILPSKVAQLPEAALDSRYGTNYRRAFLESASSTNSAVAWGAPEDVGERWAGVRKRHAGQVMAFLRKMDSSNLDSFCDFSGGSGYCTYEAAKVYKLVFHCDLSVDSLVYASRKAIDLGIRNALFVRADYFAPPFATSVDHAVCLDTLIQGRWHEERLLASVRGALSPGGAAVVDFHNWWHNPLRRLGLLRQNFPKGGSYSASGLKSLLKSSGVDEFELQRFVQEIGTNGRAGRLLKRFIPATRFLVRLPGPEVRPRLEVFTLRVSA
jgi:SAM-dependent methyltransferase